MSANSPTTAPPVTAVGVGPGASTYLTRQALQVLAQADVVVGFETVVDVIADETDATLLSCGYADEQATLETFAERVHSGETGVAVLMGDPNHSGYQFLEKVEQAVDRPVAVIPGISSVQIAASRARTPMEETTFVTLHKRGPIEGDLDRLVAAVGERHLIVLPRPYEWMPGDIAAYLVDAGADPDLTAIVFERLTHADEQATRTTLGELQTTAGGTGASSTPYSDLSVLVVRSTVVA